MDRSRVAEPLWPVPDAVGELPDLYRRAFEASPHGVGLLSREGSWLQVNPAFCEILGEPADADVLAESCRTLSRIVSEQPAEVVLRNGRVALWVAETPNFLIAHVQRQQVTEAEATSERARDKAVEASRLKSEFIANISHEIRTPLNGVLGLTQILADTTLDEKQRTYVDTLFKAGNDLMGLLNDVLDLSKIDAGAMRPESVPFDPRALIQEVSRLFEPSASIRGLSFGVAVDSTVPEMLAGDPARLRQVLSNLLSNAIKFTDTGGVSISAEAARCGEEAVNLRISVSDTGPGVSSDAQRRIFEPFAQADSSTTRRFGGSGLGLSISKRIIEMMNGSLLVESREGAGATFTVVVPLTRVSSSNRSVVAAVAPPRRHGLRVLIAEDNPINQLVLQTMLTNLGHEVDTADDGAVAVRLQASNSYDAVFMDCQMPVMDGYAATAAIRNLPGDASHVRIVALTASAMPADRDRCLNAGMDDYLSKPVRECDLVTSLAHVPQQPIGEPCAT
ncbi:MAG: two-component system, sensor histidine kinase [Actinomycetota bacterium]